MVEKLESLLEGGGTVLTIKVLFDFGDFTPEILLISDLF